MGSAPVVFAYSGLPGLEKEAREKIVRRLHETGVSEDSVYKAADEVLTQMGRTYTDVALQLLIATVGNLSVVFNEPTLLKFDGKGLHKADNYNLLGIGHSSLLRFLTETIFHPHELSTPEVINLAVYCAWKASQFIDGCGGWIDVVVLEALNTSCKTISAEDIQRRVSVMKKQESLLFDFILRKPFSSSPT